MKTLDFSRSTDKNDIIQLSSRLQIEKFRREIDNCQQIS